jgi:protoheme ferro-lyase
MDMQLSSGNPRLTFTPISLLSSAMRYWHPFTKAALDEIDADNVEAMVVS